MADVGRDFVWVVGCFGSEAQSLLGRFNPDLCTLLPCMHGIDAKFANI